MPEPAVVFHDTQQRNCLLAELICTCAVPQEFHCIGHGKTLFLNRICRCGAATKNALAFNLLWATQLLADTHHALWLCCSKARPIQACLSRLRPWFLASCR